MSIFKKLFGQSKPKPGEPLPVTDETFEEDVRCSEIPVLVDFWSPTCAPCKVMHGLLREIAPEFAGKIKFTKLNVNENAVSANLYQVKSVPTLIIFKNGRPVDGVIGLLQLNPLKEKLNAHINS